MLPGKAEIIARLQKDILPLQGFKPLLNPAVTDMGLGPIKFSFPNNSFPLGAIHEFICEKKEDTAATAGFIAGILAVLMQSDGVVVWISSSRTIFPPALHSFGIDPGRIIFIDLANERQILWAIEEALQCNGLAAVIAEIKEISFTASRRLQLAVEQSRVTGFILRQNFSSLATTACVTRWKITSLPSYIKNDMPGVGFPHWNIELLKVRNGRPGAWSVAWIEGKFRHALILSESYNEQQTKTG